jgi:hypothetical protein
MLIKNNYRGSHRNAVESDPNQVLLLEHPRRQDGEVAHHVEGNAPDPAIELSEINLKLLFIIHYKYKINLIKKYTNKKFH